MKFFINMHKINSLCIVVFLLTINSFSQSELNQETVNDSIISLSDTDDVVDLFSISLSDDELNDDTSVSDNISGLLNSSMDIFYRTAAYEFSSSFFTNTRIGSFIKRSVISNASFGIVALNKQT